MTDPFFSSLAIPSRPWRYDDPMNTRIPASAPIMTACLVMLAVFVTLDVLTQQRLVLAILFNVPIALSGLAFSRRFTGGLVIVAVIADALAGWLNARTEGSLDTVSLVNRGLLAASFALVGGMTTALSATSSRLGVLRGEEARARRERDIERVLTAVGGQPSLEGALQRVTESLAAAFGARGVVLVSGGVEEVGLPRITHPTGLAAWPVGTPLPARLIGAGPLEVISTDRAADYGLTANRALIAGFSWSGRAPFLLAVLDPRDEAPQILDDLIPQLSAALERVELSERLERNRLELERRSDMVRDLVYAFSHDLRTPLVANGVNMRLALEGAFGPITDEYRRSLEHGMEANEDLLGLADTLLLVARYESGEVRPREDAVNLEREARAVAVRLENPMREKGVKLKFHAHDDSSVRGSGPELRRVIQNLLENAVRHSPPQSSLEISLEHTADTIRFEVMDRGPGVSRDLEPRLFTRFTGGRAGGGSGLGLYLSKRIIEAHGGRIGHHPRSGGGSVFWFELPVQVATRPLSRTPSETI